MPLSESFSGIRGVWNDSLTEQAAIRYAYAFFDFLKKRNNGEKISIVLGCDTRPSYKAIKNWVIEALNCKIIDAGIAPTPAVELAVRLYKADGGIMITASHNEPYYNGFKFLDKDGAVLRPKDIGQVISFYHRIKGLGNEEFGSKYLFNNEKEIEGKDTEDKSSEISKEYISFVLGFFSKKELEKIKKAKFKVVIDPNGGAGTIAKEILEKAGVKVFGLNMEYGIFSRTIEPNALSLIYLESHIKENKADFAAGFDCDADRVELVLENGGIVSGHYLFALVADDILKNSKNKNVVVNNATSNVVKEAVEKNDGKITEVEVGEINVVDAMLKEKSPVGGEGSSGGIIIPPSRCRDGILTVLYVLKIMAEKGKGLKEIVGEYPKYFTVADKFEVKDRGNSSIKEKIIDYYSKKGCKIKKTDSIKAVFEDGSWIYFRDSKTEAGLFRIIVDSKDPEKAESLMKEAKKLLG